MNDEHDPENDDPQGKDDALEQVMSEAAAAVDAVRGEASRGAGTAPDDGDDGDYELDEVDLAAELAASQAELVAAKDRWLRALADHENYKKRVRREIDEATNRAVSSLLEDFLPVGDDLERAMSIGSVDEKFVQGLKMVTSRLTSALAKHGIVAIEPLGAAFDPSQHDALQQVDSPDHPPGMVTMVFEKGYKRGERLLRPARVIVAGPGSTGAPPPDATEDPEAGE